MEESLPFPPEEAVGRNTTIFKNHFRRIHGAHAQFSVERTAHSTQVAGFNDECADFLFSPPRSRHDSHAQKHRTLRDEHLRSVQYVGITLPFGAAVQRARVAPRSRLGQRPGPEPAFEKGRNPPPNLLFRATAQNVPSRQAHGDTNGQGEATVHPGQLFKNKQVLEMTGPTASQLFREMDAEKAQLPRLLVQIERKLAGAIALGRPWGQGFFRKIPGQPAEGAACLIEFGMGGNRQRDLQ